MNGVTGASHLQVISKFRQDTNLRYTYNGTKKPGEGRPKQMLEYQEISRLNFYRSIDNIKVNYLTLE
ncbi:MAG: hypothetical protein IPH45_20685 [Bacteroidales bacterium]|nr:hypothetical protein [Bacteroidales bacterium]MBK7173637.1 hypothetical protein [Bacteroidales bacterium]